MRTILIVLIALVLLGGGYFYWNQTAVNEMVGIEENTNKGLNPPNDSSTNTGDRGTNVNVGIDVGANVTVVKEFNITNQGLIFNPKELSVKKGDRIKITYKNGGGTHDFRIDGYNVGTNVLQGGAEQTIEFTADREGSFEFYCSVGNHRAMGMKGTFTVTE